MSDLIKHTLTIKISDRIEWIDKRCGLTDIQKDYVTAQMKEAVNDAVQQANEVIKPHEKALPMCGVSGTKPMDEDYPLIPMKDIEEEAKLLAIRWHENATNWIGDKHKLASDFMNYARRKSSYNDR